MSYIFRGVTNLLSNMITMAIFYMVLFLLFEERITALM